MWRAEDISFDFVDELTSDPVVTVLVSTPGGTLTFMAEPSTQGTTLVLRAVHAQDAHPNAVGAANLRIVARALMERLDIDGLFIEGAVRTSGANPGRRPRPIRFTRILRPPSAEGAVRPPDD
jgi:hypothetical protein